MPRKRGSRLDEQWVPDDTLIAQVAAECSQVALRAEHRVFVDYWIAQPGQKGVKTDWPATDASQGERHPPRHSKTNGTTVRRPAARRRTHGVALRSDRDGLDRGARRRRLRHREAGGPEPLPESVAARLPQPRRAARADPGRHPADADGDRGRRAVGEGPRLHRRVVAGAAGASRPVAARLAQARMEFAIAAEAIEAGVICTPRALDIGTSGRKVPEPRPTTPGRTSSRSSTRGARAGADAGAR